MTQNDRLVGNILFSTLVTNTATVPSSRLQYRGYRTAKLNKNYLDLVYASNPTGENRGAEDQEGPMRETEPDPELLGAGNGRQAPITTTISFLESM